MSSKSFITKSFRIEPPAEQNELETVARIVVTTERVSASNNDEKTPARGPKGQRQKGGSEKLIRLDDLIPKGNVKGGRQQLLFGATDTTQKTNNPKDH